MKRKAVSENIHKIDKLTKKKQRAKSPTIRNERGDIITDAIDTERIIKKNYYYEQLYAHKIDNKQTSSLKDTVCQNSQKSIQAN